MELTGDNKSFPEHSGFHPGAIFMLNRMTKEECFRQNLFAIPSAHASLMKTIRVGMFLFLFDYEERNLYGVFEVSSDSSINIIPSGFSRSVKAFSAQVCFRTLWYCEPLSEAEFRDAVNHNYSEAKTFHFELSKGQVYNLLDLFIAKRVTIQQPYSEASKLSLESRYSETSDDIEKHKLMLRDYEFRKQSGTILNHTMPSVRSGHEHETPNYLTFSASEEPANLSDVIYSSSRENSGDYCSHRSDFPHLQEKRSYIKTPTSYHSGTYTLSLPDHVHNDAGIRYIPHEPYYPTNISSQNILPTSNPPNDIRDSVVISGSYDHHVSETYPGKIDPIDLSFPHQFDRLVGRKTFYTKQGACKEVVFGVNRPIVHDPARAVLAGLTNDTTPLARIEKNAMATSDSMYPAYKGSQSHLPPKILYEVVVSDNQYEGSCSRQSKDYMDTPKARISVFSRLSGRRRISPDKKTVIAKRQVEMPVDLSSRKRNTPTKFKSQRMVRDDEECFELSSSVDRLVHFSDKKAEKKNAMSQQPAISFKRRSDAKKAADVKEKKSSAHERNSGEPSENKPRKRKLRRPSLVEEIVEKQNISHSVQALSPVAESNKTSATGQAETLENGGTLTFGQGPTTSEDQEVKVDAQHRPSVDVED